MRVDEPGRAGREVHIAALPDRLDRLDRIRALHAKWGEQSPEDADLDLWETLGRLLDGEPD